MASTNKTANLSLNQWTLDDPFLMEDFNADNSRIDAEVAKKMGMVKLKEVSCALGDVTQIDVDVSDINFSEWQYIWVDVVVSDQCILKLNNGQFATWYASFLNTQWIAGAIAYVSSGHRINFLSHKGGNPNAAVCSMGQYGFSYGYGDAPFKKLKMLNFVTLSESWKFDAGSKFTFWGVR